VHTIKKRSRGELESDPADVVMKPFSYTSSEKRASGECVNQKGCFPGAGRKASGNAAELILF